MVQPVSFLLTLLFIYYSMIAVAACRANTPLTIYVRKGRFSLGQTEFVGPCNNKSLSFSRSENGFISGLTSITNSKFFPISFFGSSIVKIQGVKVTAPYTSLNTNGINIERSTMVPRAHPSTKSIRSNVQKGPVNLWQLLEDRDHSIGSSGDAAKMAGVRNMTVRSVVFTGTRNGIRIKTWGKTMKGFVNDITFVHAVMQNVQNPITIDQNCRPGNKRCPGQEMNEEPSSGFNISRVSYTNIQGSPATPVAVKFACSPRNPCTEVGLKDIRLGYQNKRAQAFCKNARGAATGFIDPPSCF